LLGLALVLARGGKAGALVSYTHRLETDPRAIKRLRQQETANAQPLYGAAICEMPRPHPFIRHPYAAVAFLDVRKRANVRDLWRVIALEPDHQGDVRSAWRILQGGGGPTLAVLNAEWTAPVSLRLRLVFDAKKYRPFLELAAASALVLLTNMPITTGTRTRDLIGVPVEGDVLRAALFADALAQELMR
jgi:hypothetical protein